MCFNAACIAFDRSLFRILWEEKAVFIRHFARQRKPKNHSSSFISFGQFCIFGHSIRHTCRSIYLWLSFLDSGTLFSCNHRNRRQFVSSHFLRFKHRQYLQGSFARKSYHTHNIFHARVTHLNLNHVCIHKTTQMRILSLEIRGYALKKRRLNGFVHIGVSTHATCFCCIHCKTNKFKTKNLFQKFPTLNIWSMICNRVAICFHICFVWLLNIAKQSNKFILNQMLAF